MGWLDFLMDYCCSMVRPLPLFESLTDLATFGFSNFQVEGDLMVDLSWVSKGKRGPWGLNS